MIFTVVVRFDNLNLDAKGGLQLKGKVAIFIIIAFTIIALIITWFWLQDVITEYDLDTSQPSESNEWSTSTNSVDIDTSFPLHTM